MKKHLKQILQQEKTLQFLRFCIVGTLAAGLHYAIYLLLKAFIEVNISYTIGYVISLIFNFFLTTHFTFRSQASAKKAAGFGFSHLVNYLLHMVLFNAFLYVGVSKELAPLCVLAIAVPTNFILLRWVFRSK